ncbi:MAG: hypothetical protein FWH53_00825 [Leptospirales bacterium]|nr:hypothetical protein [Leptospirales bacterium]
MTRVEKIRAFIKALSEHLNIKFVRSEQSGERLTYPFMSYKILSSDPKSAQEMIEIDEICAEDDTKVIQKSTRESTIVISLNFFSDEKGYGDLFNVAEDAYTWIDSLAGLEVADEIGIGVSVVNYIQDRTVFFETEYEYKFGFDFEVRDKAVKTEIVDAVDIAETIKEIKQGEQNG